MESLGQDLYNPTYLDKKTWHPHYAKKHDPAPTPETYGIIGIIDLREDNFIIKLKQFSNTAANFDAKYNSSSCKLSFKFLTKLIDKFEQGSDEDWNTCLKKPDVDHFLYEPREGASGTFKCTDCSAVYKSASSFKKHNKLKLKKTVVAKGPTTKCRLKHQRGTRAKEDHAYDQITSHLHLVHGMQKPAKGLNSTGWVTTDDKKTWHPHYAKKHDPAPTPETYVRVQYTSTKKQIKLVLVIIQQLQQQPTTFFF